MSMQFFETVMGHRFFEGQFPQLIRSIERLTDAVEKQNELVTKQNELMEKFVSDKAVLSK